MTRPIKFQEIRFQNLFSYGNNLTSIRLDYPRMHLIAGGNGNGKCLNSNTFLDIEITDDEVARDFAKFLDGK